MSGSPAPRRSVQSAISTSYARRTLDTLAGVAGQVDQGDVTPLKTPDSLGRYFSGRRKASTSEVYTTQAADSIRFRFGRRWTRHEA